MSIPSENSHDDQVQSISIVNNIKRENPVLNISSQTLPNIIAIKKELPHYHFHAFYYPWYGSKEFDGEWIHWNHQIIPHWDKEIDRKYRKYNHDPPDDIASEYYPELGPYSSSDPKV